MSNRDEELDPDVIPTTHYLGEISNTHYLGEISNTLKQINENLLHINYTLGFLARNADSR